VMAKTVNGNVTMSGPLAKSGLYAFTNMTGDILLAMPHDASFQLNAKVSEKHNILSDFALKYLSDATPPPPPPAVVKPKAEVKAKPPKTEIRTPETPETKQTPKVQPAPKAGPVI